MCWGLELEVSVAGLDSCCARPTLCFCERPPGADSVVRYKAAIAPVVALKNRSFNIATLPYILATCK